MEYLLDGYNILFSLDNSSQGFKVQREKLIEYLQERFTALKLKGLLIFDGFHRKEEESGRSYKSPLEIIYTPKDQNADSFIVEKIQLSKNPKEFVLVTNDAGLKRHARALGSRVQPAQEFLLSLEKTAPGTNQEKPRKETTKNIERLLKIFEEKKET